MPAASTPEHETLAQALTAAQADMPAVEPDAVNPHFRSRFVSLDNLIAKTRPVLNRHGLTITQWPSTLDGGAPALTTRLTHVGGEFVDSTMPLILAKQDMQGLGGAITYARRYMWAAALGIAGEEDDDGNQASATNGKTDTANGNASNGAAAMKKAAAAAAKNATPEQADQLVEIAGRLVAADRSTVGQIASALNGDADTVDGLRPLVLAVSAQTATDLLGRLARYEANAEKAAAAR